MVLSGVRVAYLATDRDLAVIIEIFSGTPGADRKPGAAHPDARTDRRDDVVNGGTA